MGWGTFRAWPIKSEQSEGKEFSNTMLCIDTLKIAAMLPQVSFCWTEYTIGVNVACGVKVGKGVSGVAVGVTDGDGVALGTPVGTVIRSVWANPK